MSPGTNTSVVPSRGLDLAPGHHVQRLHQFRLGQSQQPVGVELAEVDVLALLERPEAFDGDGADPHRSCASASVAAMTASRILCSFFVGPSPLRTSTRNDSITSGSDLPFTRSA